MQNFLTQRNALLPLLLVFVLEYATSKVPENQVGLKLNEENELLAYSDDVNLLEDNIHCKSKVHYRHKNHTQKKKLMTTQYRLPLWSSGQGSWLQIQKYTVQFPVLPNFLRSILTGTRSTQPRKYNCTPT
jgi:hypothetical protein